MKPTAIQIKEAARRYLKIVEWSDDDKCYVGSAPPLIGQSCHRRTESDVMVQVRGTSSDVDPFPNRGQSIRSHGSSIGSPGHKTRYAAPAYVWAW